uniref:Uncharacterized protein n=1 Tax=Pelusios castaneus TaxID=367368 RepID=A0A8C8VR66_9SAUR
MSQARIPQHLVLSSDQNGAAAPDEESHSRLFAIPDTTDQMVFNISSATQVGHQLAVIGDEFNRTYTTSKLEDMLFHLAQGMAVSVFQTCIWSIFKGVIKSFRSLLNNGWTKRVAAYGSWISRLPLKSMCQKLMPAALFAILLWWTVSYALQN